MNYGCCCYDWHCRFCNWCRYFPYRWCFYYCYAESCQ
nr:MAG TPA: hypothetical protein [Microviridae sp.]